MLLQNGYGNHQLVSLSHVSRVLSSQVQFYLCLHILLHRLFCHSCCLDFVCALLSSCIVYLCYRNANVDNECVCVIMSVFHVTLSAANAAAGGGRCTVCCTQCFVGWAVCFYNSCLSVCCEPHEACPLCRGWGHVEQWVGFSDGQISPTGELVM